MRWSYYCLVFSILLMMVVTTFGEWLGIEFNVAYLSIFLLGILLFTKEVFEGLERRIQVCEEKLQDLSNLLEKKT